MEPLALLSYRTANANSTHATESKHAQHIGKVPHITGSLENGEAVLLQLVISNMLNNQGRGLAQWQSKLTNLVPRKRDS